MTNKPAAAEHPTVDAAQEFLNRVSPLGTPLSEADSFLYRKLLEACGHEAVGLGDALKEPPNHRFAPLPTKAR